MVTTWQPFHEPLRVTLLRTGLIGLVVEVLLLAAARAEFYL